MQRSIGNILKSSGNLEIWAHLPAHVHILHGNEAQLRDARVVEAGEEAVRTQRLAVLLLQNLATQLPHSQETPNTPNTQNAERKKQMVLARNARKCSPSEKNRKHSMSLPA